MFARPTLSVKPQRAIVDEPLAIRAAGFTPGSAVEINASMTDGYGVVWKSTISCETDATGALDLSTQAAKDANGIADPMRLIWSMRPASQPQPMVYLAPPDLADETVQFTASDSQGNSAAAASTRIHLPPHVQRTEVAEAGLFGALFVPEGRQRGATIVVLSSSVGGMNERDAALFAAHGYTALALAYFNYKQLPPVLSHIPLEYFEKALKWLAALDCVDEQRMAITGRSRGGEAALLLGATFPQIKCVLADVPSGLIWEGYGIDDRRPSPAWTWRGAPLPFLPNRAYAALERQSQTADRRWDPERFLRDAGIAADRLRRSEIKVENINGAVLLISAGDDRVWPSAILSQVAERRLAQSRFPHRFERASYRTAGHYVVTPYIPTTVLSATHPVTGDTYPLGGTAEGTYAAGVDAWRRKLEFLDAALRSSDERPGRPDLITA